MKQHRWFINLLVFFSGFVTLGAELTASRLLAPYFGTSLPVWSSLIGLILIALSLGYLLGGRLADRRPHLPVLLWVVVGAGVLTAMVPLAAPLILDLAASALVSFQGGLLLGAFVGVLVLLGLPMTLFGMLTPFAIRLATHSVADSGRTAGRLFAVSTLGSFLGSLLPSVVLVPLLGTRWTFFAFGALMLLVAALGFALHARKGGVIAAMCAFLLTALAGTLTGDAAIRKDPGLIFEGESEYQYVRVIDRKSGWRVLQLNEGLVVHSKYNKNRPLTYGEWDYFALAPFFNPAPAKPAEAKRWAIIGAGAGTTAKLVLRCFPEATVVGVELDPLVVEVGRRFFDADDPRYIPVVSDGRGWLNRTSESFDVIGVDAYQQPYIPFELTTTEFFSDIRDHLNERGVLAMNISSPPGDDRLVNALATTVATVFPSIFLLDLPDSSMATILVATRQPSTLKEFGANQGHMHPLLKHLVRPNRVKIRTEFAQSTVLTDDTATVERLVDQMVFRQVMRMSGGERP